MRNARQRVWFASIAVKWDTSVNIVSSQSVSSVSTAANSSEENRSCQNCLQPESYFIGTMSSDNETSWSVDIQIKQKIVSFKMDTDAEVTAIYQLLGKPELKSPSKTLYGPAHQTLKVLGQFSGWLKYGQRSTPSDIRS